LSEPATAPSDVAERDIKPLRKKFVRRFASPSLPAGAVERQGRVVSLAWAALRDRDAALAFLNAHDEELGGRPIDLAVAGPEQMAAVEAAIAARASAGIAPFGAVAPPA
jgi:hypothetical protein